MDIRTEVDRLFDDSSLPTDAQPIAVIISGDIAAGKTTLRRQKYATGYVLIDAVDIFLSLSRGEYFDFPDGLEEPMDRIGRLVAKRAVAERRNIVTEIVGVERGPTLQLIEGLKSVEYRVQGEVITGDVDEELRRNEARGDDDISSFYAEPFQRAWIIGACHPRKILYIDMDGVLVDFQSGLDRVPADVQAEYKGHEDDIPGIFALMDPMPGAVEAYLGAVAGCSTPTSCLRRLGRTRRPGRTSWSGCSGTSAKAAYKRLILTHHKDLNRGDFLVDDRRMRGAAEFEGELIPFGSEEFPDWRSVVEYLRVASQDSSPAISSRQEGSSSRAAQIGDER